MGEIILFVGNPSFYNVAYNAPTNGLFYSNNLLKLKDTYKFYFGVYKLNPATDSVNTDNYNIRRKNNLIPSFARLKLTRHSIVYTEPKLCLKLTKHSNVYTEPKLWN